MSVNSKETEKPLKPWKDASLYAEAFFQHIIIDKFYEKTRNIPKEESNIRFQVWDVPVSYQEAIDAEIALRIKLTKAQSREEQIKTLRKTLPTVINTIVQATIDGPGKADEEIIEKFNWIACHYHIPSKQELERMRSDSYTYYHKKKAWEANPENKWTPFPIDEP